MSSKDQYRELLQQKRNELDVKVDVQTDWHAMSTLLDTRMPVSSAASSASNAGKQLWHLSKFKLFYALGGFIVGGIITYMAITHKLDRPVHKNHKANKTEINQTKTATDSILHVDRASNQVSAQDSVTSKPIENQEAGDNTSTDNSSKPTTGVEINRNTVTANNNSSATTNKSNKAAANSIVSNTTAILSGTGTRKPSGSSNSALTKSNLRLSAAMGHNHARVGSYSQIADSRAAINQHSKQYGLGLNSDEQRDNYNLSGTENQAPQNGSVLIKAATTPLLTWDAVAPNQTDLSKAINNPFEPVRLLSTTKSGKKQKGERYDAYFDYGVLLGVNTSGSFTPKSQNANFYGSTPVDAYAGIYINYNFSDKWAIGAQGRFLAAHSTGNVYNRTIPLIVNSMPDTQKFTIINTRKLYSVDIPVHFIYKASPHLSLKAGPLLSIPVKDVNEISFSQQTYKDSTRFLDSLKNKLRSTTFVEKMRYGVSAGLGYTYKSFWIDATYSFYPPSAKVTTALGQYSDKTNNLQITIGLKLSKETK